MDDFLVIYHSEDRQYANQIYQWLLDSEFHASISSPVFDNDQPFEGIMEEASQKAVRVIALFSSKFINQLIKEENWKEAITNNPSRDFIFTIPVLIEPFNLKILEVQKVFIDLSDLEMNKAKIPLLFALRNLLNSTSESDRIKTFL
ncbi:TIR domain-containing protein [Gracilimonas sediminicola]|uniref:TIR domain-containing protein n=1 Tax=Gracilimonas sediminicola TaxID=2952158 RepID=UPI0038D35F64